MKILILFVAIFVKTSQGLEGNDVTILADGVPIIKHQNVSELDKDVKIEIYYQAFCPRSRNFYVETFGRLFMNLMVDIDIYTYPFGKAQLSFNDTGCFSISCSNGPEECYGHRLHACVHLFLDFRYPLMIACLMSSNRDGNGSDDTAMDDCGKMFGMDPTFLKLCAKTNMGNILHLLNGVETSKVSKNFKKLPYILVNGVESTPETFKEDVCKQVKYPPHYCDKDYEDDHFNIDNLSPEVIEKLNFNENYELYKKALSQF